MLPKIYIRADGGLNIGLGHITRCLGLGEMLSEDFDITFVIKEVPESILKRIKDKKFGIILIKEEKDFLNVLDECEIVIIDGYDFDLGYEQEIKKYKVKLVKIDDLAGITTIADLIINHSPNITRDEYVAPSTSMFSLGSQYALLRPQFLKLAANEESIVKGKNSLFLSFGGSDFNGFTIKILEYLERMPGFKKINVVVGASFNRDNALALLADKDCRIHLYKGITETEILELMTESEIAIVPASGLLFELVCTNTIPIIGFYVPNQQKFHDFMTFEAQVKSFGNFLDLNFDTFEKTLKSQLQHLKLNEALKILRLKMASSKQNHLRQFKLLLNNDRY